MTPDVNCYAGSSYPEHPRQFEWQNRQYTVKTIIHRRREPDGFGFIVRCHEEEALFELFYHTEDQNWHIQPKATIIIEDSPRKKSDQITFFK